MVSFADLLETLAAFVILTATATANADSTLKGFTLNQVVARRHHQNDSESKMNTIRKRQSATLETMPVRGDMAHVVDFTIDGTTVQMILDTGSDYFWAFSSHLPDLEGHETAPCNGRISELDNWEILYEDGSEAAGDWRYSNVTSGPLTLTNFSVGCASSASPFFRKRNEIPDGIVGLAFQRGISPKTFFEHLRPTLPQPLFAASLGHGKPGFFDFGFINESAYREPVVRVPVENLPDSTGLRSWTVMSDGISVGDGSKVSKSFPILPDTGTSVIWLPSDLAREYWNQVQGIRTIFGSYHFPCDTELPDFNIFFNNTKFVVPGNYMNYTAVPPTSDGLCQGGIQVSPMPELSILGIVGLSA